MWRKTSRTAIKATFFYLSVSGPGLSRPPYFSGDLKTNPRVWWWWVDDLKRGERHMTYHMLYFGIRISHHLSLCRDVAQPWRTAIWTISHGSYRRFLLLFKQTDLRSFSVQSTAENNISRGWGNTFRRVRFFPRYAGQNINTLPNRQNVQQLKKEHRRSLALINKAQESLWLPKPSVLWTHGEEGGAALQTKKMG